MVDPMDFAEQALHLPDRQHDSHEQNPEDHAVQARVAEKRPEELAVEDENQKLKAVSAVMAVPSLTGKLNLMKAP